MDGGAPTGSRRITKDANGNIVGGLFRPQAHPTLTNEGQDTKIPVSGAIQPKGDGNVGYGITANTNTTAQEAPQACEFRCGDVVHPKASLTPYMTVESVSWNGHSKRVHTVWFDNTNKLHRDSFDPDTLKHKA